MLKMTNKMKQVFLSIGGSIRAALRTFLSPVQSGNFRPALVMAASLPLFLSACSKAKLKGEGATISETRSLSAFSVVESNGSNQVVIVKDSVYMAVVTGYQNLVPAFETRVSGERLILEYKDRYYNIKNDNIVIEVHTPNVSNAQLKGSGNIRIGGGFKGNFYGRIDGSGNMYLDASSFHQATYHISGSGNIDARAAMADTAFATISGSGNIDLSVKSYLDARISGSGNINYFGNPVVNTEVSGSGHVRKR